MKEAHFHPAARDTLRSFPEDVRRAFGMAIYDLQVGHALGMSLSRPMPSLHAGAAELRVSDASRQYRAFYLVGSPRAVLIFHAFVKKARKTPKREMALGRKRLQEMLR